MAKAERYVLENACKYAALAYEDEIENAIKIESRLTSTTAFVVKRKHNDIICFRGTQQLRDWLFNLSAIPVPYAGRLCHSGFVAAHASVWGKIKKHIDFDKPTLICGHSLGGALAELSAAKIHKKHTQLSLVTFGKPNTFIPRLCYGPSVSQSIIFHANNGDDFVDPSSELKRRDFMSAKKEAISDHFMPGYKKRLLKFLSRGKSQNA